MVTMKEIGDYGKLVTCLLWMKSKKRWIGCTVWKKMKIESHRCTVNLARAGLNRKRDYGLYGVPVQKLS